MSEPALGRDEQQEFRQSSRRTIETAAIFWDELEASTMSNEACEMVFSHWLKFIFTPELKFPDFKDLFGKLGGSEE